jgi:hypothetical protein
MPQRQNSHPRSSASDSPNGNKVLSNDARPAHAAATPRNAGRSSREPTSLLAPTLVVLNDFRRRKYVLKSKESRGTIKFLRLSNERARPATNLDH